MLVARLFYFLYFIGIVAFGVATLNYLIFNNNERIKNLLKNIGLCLAWPFVATSKKGRIALRNLFKPMEVGNDN